jgi:hypothetical protein
LPHTREQLVREKCAFGALLRPGQQTYCDAVKVENGGDGHFQANAEVPCLTSFGGFMPDNLRPNPPTIANTIDADM